MGERTTRVRSMTGIGQGAAERDGLRVEVELKGVNHRFLDVKMKLPAEAGPMEPSLRGAVQERVSRGRIDISVSLASTRPPARRVSVDRELVAGFLEAADHLKKQFRLKGSIGLETILALPGVLSVQIEKEGADGAAALVPEALRQALAGYDAMRAEEGNRLAADLRDHLAAIRESARRILAEAAGLPESYLRRLKERLALLLQGERSPDESRLAQEVALLSGRVDITEEIVRLQGFVDQAEATLERAAGPIGKMLDFIMQEMNREANTISSKAESLPIRQEALLIKAEVEKIREQVQNLE